jgi:molybdopterin synthase sulfur carrier subunit
MTIRIQYFASLRDRIGRDGDQVEAAEAVATARALWEQLHGGIPPRLMVAVNQRQASLDSPVVDGDEVAFFPPVTGG